MNFDSQILNVPVEDIVPNRFQPRLNFEDQSLQELAESIKQHGIIQPLVLRRVGDKYEIVAGERRYKASKIAGLTSVPAVISKIDDKTSAEVAIAENIQRKQISSIEEARSYKALLDQGYMTSDMLAQKMGIPASSLENKLKLLALSNPVQQAVIENRISERHAKALLKVPNENDQVFWLNRIINERLTVKQLDDLLKNYKGSEQTMDNQMPNNQVPTPPIAPMTNLQSAETISAPSTPLSMSLGETIDERKANDLEAEAANMSMSEPTSIFAQMQQTDASNSFTPLMADMPSVPQTPAVEEIPTPSPTMPTMETLDSLDTLSPAPSASEVQSPKKDVTGAVMKLSSVINELRAEGYNISFNMNDLNDKMNLSIDILK